MNSDLKPIVDQIKSKLSDKLSEANVDQIKQQVVQGVQIGRQIVEAKAKDIFKQSKNSKIVNEHVIPFLESDKANKAIEVMNDKLKLKDTPLMNKILELRQELIDSKIEKAKPAEPIAATEAPHEDTADEQPNN